MLRILFVVAIATVQCLVIRDKPNQDLVVKPPSPAQQGRSKDGRFSNFGWMDWETSWKIPSLKMPSMPSLSDVFDYEYDYTYDSTEIQNKFNYFEKVMNGLKDMLKKKSGGEEIGGNDKGLTNRDRNQSFAGNNQSLTNTDKPFTLSNTNATAYSRVNNSHTLEDSNIMSTKRVNILSRILENYLSCRYTLCDFEDRKPLSIEINIDNFSLIVPRESRNFSENLKTDKKVEVLNPTNVDRELGGKTSLAFGTDGHKKKPNHQSNLTTMTTTTEKPPRQGCINCQNNKRPVQPVKNPASDQFVNKRPAKTTLQPTTVTKIAQTTLRPTTVTKTTKTTEVPELVAEPTKTTKIPELIKEPTKTTEAPALVAEPPKTTKIPDLVEEPTKTTEAPALGAEPTKTTKIPELVEEPTKTTEAPALVAESPKTTKIPELVEEPTKTAEVPALVAEPTKATNIAELVEEPPKTAEVPESVAEPTKTTKFPELVEEPPKPAELPESVAEPTKTTKIPELVEEPPKPAEVSE